MKGKKWLIWVLAVCLLAGCCGALAEDWPPKGKTEGTPLYGIDEMNRVIYSRNEYSQDENTRDGITLMLSGADGEVEQATNVEVTFLGGDEALKGLFSCEKFLPETIWVNTPKEGVTGKADFRIRAESEHFYLEKEVHPEVRILDLSGMNLDAFVYRVEVGQEADFFKLMGSELYYRRIPVHSIAFEKEGLREADTDEYLLNNYGSCFTARQEGDWWLDCVITIDTAGTKLRVPMILHTGDTLRPETASKLEEYRNANGISAETAETGNPEAADGAGETQESAEAGEEEPQDAAAAEKEETQESAEAGTEEPQDTTAAENGAVPESAAAEEAEEPYVKPVAEDPQGENWARYISEKILPALEPTLTKESFTFTKLPLHGGQDSNMTYGTKFYFSRPQDGAILGSMHVHFAGAGDGQDYRNAAVPFILRHFFPLTNYLIAGDKEAELPISAEAIRTYSLDQPYNVRDVSYFHQVYEGKDWQVMAVYFAGEQDENGFQNPLDGKNYIFLVIQDLDKPQALGFCTTDNYVIADQDMVEQIQSSILTWEHMPEVISLEKEESLNSWYEARVTEKPENETGPESVTGEWKSVATYGKTVSALLAPSTMVMMNLSGDGTGTVSFNNGEKKELTWETEGRRVTYYRGEQRQDFLKIGNRLYLPKNNEKGSIVAVFILVRPDDPLYYRTYARGNETYPYGFSIGTKDNSKELTAGKNLTFKAEFDHPETVNQKAKNNQVQWNVSLPDGSGAEEYAKISNKGVLTVAKNLTERVRLDVRAASQGGTTAVYHLEAVPTLKELKIEPDQVVLYLGESKGIKLKVRAEPADAMPKNPKWSNNNKAKYLGLSYSLEIPDELNVYAKDVGKTTITVKDPLSGKTGKATVTVLQPVTSVMVMGPMSVKAGKTASFKAFLEPTKDIDKTVIWSVDVDESIATISAKGQLKVAKDVPAGTVITVTARAQGTENIVQTSLSIPVE